MTAVAVLWERELKRFFRQASRVIGALGQPVLFWLVIGGGLAGSFRMPGQPETGYLEYFFGGVVVMVVLFTSIFSTISVIEDRHAGFLQAVLVAPASRLSLVLGKVLGGVTVALVQAALFLLFAPLAGFSFSAIHWPALAASLLVLAVGLTSLGFFLAWFLDSTQGYHAVMSLLLIPMWVLSGAMFPVEGAHGWLAGVMRANPLTYGVDAVRASLAGAAPSALDAAVLAGFAAGSLAAAVWACRRKA